jgi:hypothetical protein
MTAAEIAAKLTLTQEMALRAIEHVNFPFHEWHRFGADFSATPNLVWIADSMADIAITDFGLAVLAALDKGAVE